MARLPNFFLAGVPKAGTTSLYRYLSQHPRIFTSAIKEPLYFASEMREEHYDASVLRATPRVKQSGGIVTDWEQYLGLFAGATNETAIGEGSVAYLWSPTAATRIAEAIPDAKIVVMLRDPADRAFSQYLQGVGSGTIQWSFREQIERNLHHRSSALCAYYPFLEYGFYGEQVERCLERFGKNVGIWFYEDYRARPLDVCLEIFRFLGVSPDFAPDMSRRYWESQAPRFPLVARLKRIGAWEAAANLTPRRLRPAIRRLLVRKPGAVQMEHPDRRYLIDFYREDIQRLAALVDRDPGVWLRTTGFSL